MGADVVRTLDDHRRQYEVGAARARLREEVVAERERVALRTVRAETVRAEKEPHVHRYSQFTFTCSCGKHGRAW